MIHKAKKSPTAQAAARSLAVALRTWALGLLVILLFLAFRAHDQSSYQPDCTGCAAPAKHSARQ